MRAAIYARISKDTEGTELGVKRQQDDCRREADRRGWDVVGTYVDNDVSATRTRVRPEFQRMIRDIESGQVQAVIVWALDRLTRSPRELEDIIDVADRFKVELANVSGTINLSTPEGRAMARQMGTFARLEVENMSKRLTRKFQEKAENGEPHGRTPYGFKRVDGRDVVDKATASVVREIAKRILANESLRRIAADLNRRDVPGPAADRWNTTVIRQIMLRPANAGFRVYRGEIIGDSNGEKLMSRERYEEIRDVLTDPTRKQNQVGPTPKYLLGGIAICGRCGGRMRRVIGRIEMEKRTGKKRRQPPAYQCSECFRVRRKQESVDAVVEATMIARLSRPDAVAAIAKDAHKGEATRLRKEIRAVDTKLNVAADQFASDAITAQQLKRISERLRMSRSKLERQLESVTPRKSLAALAVDDVARNWEHAPMQLKREAIEAFMTVTIMPSGPGQRFNPEDVQIVWKET